MTLVDRLKKSEKKEDKEEEEEGKIKKWLLRTIMINIEVREGSHCSDNAIPASAVLNL